MGSFRNGWFRWHLFLTLLYLITQTTARPQEQKQISSTPASNLNDNRIPPKTDAINPDANKKPQDAKSNTTAIRESIKMVASQLLQGDSNPPPTSRDGGIVIDIRTPPKLKTIQAIKNKVKAIPTTSKPQSLENSHAGIAMAMTPEELENEVTVKRNQSSLLTNKESSTSDEGISTWILLSGSPATTTTLPPKNQVKKIDAKEEKQKPEDKPAQFKPKPKPTPKPTAAPKPMFTRRPIAIGSSNKADLIASGSAVNENVMNKIKASVLASVQKNKNAALNKTTTASTTTKETTTTITTTTTQPPTKSEIVVTYDPKPISTSKINDIETATHNMRRDSEIVKKAEPKISQAPTENLIIPDTLNMGIEAKEAEIELEVSTPPMPTSKKPKRTSSKRKKNKNRRRKPSASSTTAKPELPELKIAKEPTKAVSKVPTKDKPFTTQIYNYFSREVMPSMGVGLVSLAGLVGLASYFLYPFSGVVRRAYDTNDRKDDLYYQNGESYATEDAGQSEEEMLGKVLAGMPSESINEQNINPYIGQTQFRYPQPKPQEQNLRYRNVPYNSEINSYVSSDRVGQQSSDVHGSAYSEQIHYDTHTVDRNDNFSPYHQPQPVYKAVEKVVESAYPIEPNYNNMDKITSPLYSEKASSNTYDDSKSSPTYSDANTYKNPSYSDKISAPSYVQAITRYNQEMMSESTDTPSVETLHLGVDDIIEKQKETGYTVGSTNIDDNKQPQFVVGNVPKELIQAVTPITVPEHGPRSLRIRRDTEKVQIIHARSIADNLEAVLKDARENVTDPDLSNEIDEALGLPPKKQYSKKDKIQSSIKSIPETTTKHIIEDTTTNVVSINDIGSYLSTRKYDATIESKSEENSNKTEIEFLPNINEIIDVSSTTKKSEKLFIDVTTPDSVIKEEPTTIQEEADTTENPDSNYPDVEPEYYPKKHTFFSFLKSLFEFKVRLGMSLLQTTTESIARYLRGVETHLRSAAQASDQTQSYYYKH